MEAQDTRDYTKLTEIDSMACSRLVRLLRVQGLNQDRLGAYLREQMEEALNDL